MKIDRPITLTLRFFKYVAAGGMAASVHYSVLSLLVILKIAAPVLSSTIGAIAGAIVNYLFNCFFTFSGRASHWQAAPRFAVIALITITLNSALMAWLTVQMTVHFLVAQIITTGILLIFTFGMNTFWTFRERRYTHPVKPPIENV